jgi:hypothetical protein
MRELQIAAAFQPVGEQTEEARAIKAEVEDTAISSLGREVEVITLDIKGGMDIPQLEKATHL